MLRSQEWDRRPIFFMPLTTIITSKEAEKKKMYLLMCMVLILYTTVQLLYYQGMCMQLIEPEHHNRLQLSS